LIRVVQNGESIGVKAVLSRSPGRPDWQPSTLNGVWEKPVIQNFFSSPSKYLTTKPEFYPTAGYDKPKHPMRYALSSQGGASSEGGKGWLRWKHESVLIPVRYIVHRFALDYVRKSDVLSFSLCERVPVSV
jgi:hypothetical protein